MSYLQQGRDSKISLNKESLFAKELVVADTGDPSKRLALCAPSAPPPLCNQFPAESMAADVGIDAWGRNLSALHSPPPTRHRWTQMLLSPAAMCSCLKAFLNQRDHPNSHSELPYQFQSTCSSSPPALASRSACREHSRCVKTTPALQAPPGTQP